MKTRECSVERLQKDARRVLEYSFWIDDLYTQTRYERIHDDHDGTYEGRLTVCIGRDSDVWIETDTLSPMRFRTYHGGGKSFRVRNALMILALAIKLDNEEFPQVRTM